MGVVVCQKDRKTLWKENQNLKREIEIKENELISKERENNEKIRMLKNNNELLKNYCINLQSQLLSLIQQNNFQWNFINSMNAHGNINQFLLNPNNNTNNGQPVIINMVFIINQKDIYTLPVLSHYKLNDIFQNICSKLNYTINKNKIRFTYNAEDITQYFFSNQEVRSLNIRCDNPTINVTL